MVNQCGVAQEIVCTHMRPQVLGVCEDQLLLSEGGGGYTLDSSTVYTCQKQTILTKEHLCLIFTERYRLDWS